MHKLLLCVLGLLLLAAFPITAKATPPNVHGLGNLRRSLAEEDSILSSLETFYYNQTLDHFNYQPQSFVTFPQRYLINSKYWGGGDAPIFVYLGGEDVLEDDIKLFGFIHESAPRFKALVVYLEYPHVAVGALASSAPILYLDEIVPPDGFFQIVSRDYRVINV
nr:lysosomal Pro-X carboxypeptidase-like [Ipomoea batatas]